MTSYRRGDVVFVQFPFTNQTTGKRRPALVISTDEYNESTPDLTLLSVTSNTRPVPHPGDHVLQDWKQAGLLKPSRVQTKAVTVDSFIIVRRIGTVSTRDLALVEQGVRTAFGL